LDPLGAVEALLLEGELPSARVGGQLARKHTRPNGTERRLKIREPDGEREREKEMEKGETMKG